MLLRELDQQLVPVVPVVPRRVVPVGQQLAKQHRLVVQLYRNAGLAMRAVQRQRILGSREVVNDCSCDHTQCV